MKNDANFDWVSQYMSQVSESDLEAMSLEIIEHRSTGVLRPRALLRKVDNDFQAHFNEDCAYPREVEAAVLLEVNRRYHNWLEDEHEATVAGWLLTCDREVILYERGESEEPWEYMVAAADWPEELRLGVFDNKDSALKFIKDNGYVFNGETVDYGKA